MAGDQNVPVRGTDAGDNAFNQWFMQQMWGKPQPPPQQFINPFGGAFGGLVGQGMQGMQGIGPALGQASGMAAGMNQMAQGNKDWLNLQQNALNQDMQKARLGVGGKLAGLGMLGGLLGGAMGGFGGGMGLQGYQAQDSPQMASWGRGMGGPGMGGSYGYGVGGTAQQNGVWGSNTGAFDRLNRYHAMNDARNAWRYQPNLRPDPMAGTINKLLGV